VSQILGQSVRSGVAEEGLAQAQVLQQLGRAVEAKQIYREILASDPLNARVVHYLGMAEHQTGERELGRTLVDRSILLAPQNAAFFSNRGSMAEAMGDPSVAQRDFQRAITLQPALPEARANLGSLLVRSNEIQAAIRCFHSSIVLAPVSAQPWLGISLAVGRQADKQTAVIAVQRVVTLDPLSIDGLFQLGSLHHLLGESQAALTSFSKLATLRPDHGEYIFRLAAIQYFGFTRATPRHYSRLMPRGCGATVRSLFGRARGSCCRTKIFTARTRDRTRFRRWRYQCCCDFIADGALFRGLALLRSEMAVRESCKT